MAMKQGEFKEELTRILTEVRASKMTSRNRERELELEISRLKGVVGAREKELDQLKSELDKAGLRQKFEEALAEKRGVVKKAPDDIPGATPVAAPKPSTYGRRCRRFHRRASTQ